MIGESFHLQKKKESQSENDLKEIIESFQMKTNENINKLGSHTLRELWTKSFVIDFIILLLVCTTKTQHSQKKNN